MSKKIIISLREKSKRYPIIIGFNNFKELIPFLPTNQKVGIITDQVVQKLYLPPIQETLRKQGKKFHTYSFPAGESSKNSNTVEKIWTALIHHHYERNDIIVALGGGVVGDIAGFVASTILRGIPYVQIPTTLLAQVDSSIGGKTGIDFAGGKNLVGSFYQPQLVLINLKTLSTLPLREMLTGYAECLKHGLIADRKYWNSFAGKKPNHLSRSHLAHLVFRSCQIKATIVKSDEKEKNLRRLVNFGHTIGHALETSTKFCTYTHGEAVSIGMVGASWISYLLGWLPKKELEEIQHKLHLSGLPTVTSRTYKQQIMRAISLDKKVQQGQVQWTLLKNIGHGTTGIVVKPSLVEKALGAICVC